MGVAVLAGRRAEATAPLAADTEEPMVQLNEFPFVPSLPACSKATDNCLETGCCDISGATCYHTFPGQGFCNLTCNPALKGYSCQPVPNRTTAVTYVPATGLYCISVYISDTGSTKKSYAKELLSLQLKSKYSIFGCDGWDVFGDTAVDLGGVTTIAVQDVNGEFHFAKRKETGTWVNWGLFHQVWLKVREIAKWKTHDYTVKVDPETVFLPSRLKTWLQGKPVSWKGVYYENCPGVHYGFFGNIEVMSHDGIAVYLSLLEDCHSALGKCAKTGCDWKFGPWGEDVFAQRCMDRGLVAKVEAFDLTLDGNCPKNHPPGLEKDKKWEPNCGTTCTPAMHKFSKPAKWLSCLQATQAATC